jgi:4-amino-4-deoxy-L-arabinose transferase-like glycosyltransferase
LKNKNSIWIIIAAGLLARIFFYLFGARIYYGNPDFTVNGDTFGWIDSILNLVHHGTYTSDLNVENGLYYRPPGFGYFIGLFYFLGGENIANALKIIPWVQIAMDTICIFFIYKISLRLFNDRKGALIASTLYAFYPFIIVWNPVVVAESSSIFFLLASIYFYYSGRKYSYIWSGLLLGVAVLTRLQTIFIFPFMVLALLIPTPERKIFKKHISGFIISFSLIYGMWPARNYFLHDRLLFSQDLNVGKNWSPDYLAFMDFMFAVQTDHRPQYDQIINNTTVVWPERSTLNPADSAMLANTITLCRKCGTGFSYFMFHAGKVKSTVPDSVNCDLQIAENFRHLTSMQKSNNALNYYLKVPLSNLYKTFFKLHLYGEKDWKVNLFSLLLFLYRTILIFAGIAGLIVMFKREKQAQSFVILTGSFFISWYCYLSFIYRNIEIRYLLPVDILLLLPAAYLITILFRKHRFAK